MDLNLEATELRLGLPGAPSSSGKRSSTEMGGNPVQKQQVVGWPPVRSYRKNTILKKVESSENGSGMFVKVSMDGAPYLRKIDLKFYNNYADLLKALENMFKCDLGVQSEREGCSDHAPTYEDKDGDWMLVGDVPWEMFITSCQRMRIMRGSEARGLQIQQLFTK